MNSKLLFLFVLSIHTAACTWPIYNVNETIICQYKDDEPAVQPNIYICNATTKCCKIGGVGSCCETQMTKAQFWKAVVPPLLFFTGIWAAISLFYIYYEDTEMDYDPEAKTDSKIMQHLFTADNNFNVRDPVFGRQNMTCSDPSSISPISYVHSDLYPTKRLKFD